MSARKLAQTKHDASLIDDEQELIEQAIEQQFHEHPDYNIVELYEDDDFPEWD